MSQRATVPWVGRVLVIAALSGGAWVGARAQQLLAFDPLLCKPLPYGGGSRYWISLPPQGPIRSATALYDALGGPANVLHVRKIFPESSQRTFDGTCTNAEPSPPCATPADPAPCFCINPGEGVEVRLSVSPGVLRILGIDSGTTIPLTAGATAAERYLISLPYRAAIYSASDLLADLGTTNVSEVRRWVPSTGAIEVYRASGPGSVNFPVVSGEGYEVVVRPGITMNYVPSVNPPISFPTCSALCDDYSISGTGTGSLFTWQVLDAASTALCGTQFNSFAPGDDSATMAMKFRDFVASNTTCQAMSVTATSPGGTASPVFRVCIGSSGPPALWVGSPPCLVSSAGCSFNPTIQVIVLPPADPGLLTLRKSGTTIAILDWNDIGDPGLTWNIYRNGVLWAASISDSDPGTPGIQWSDPEVPAVGRLFTYIVRAENSAGESLP